jgi:hypothetical protein
VIPSAALKLLTKQDGVTSRSQLLGLGIDDNAIEVLVRRHHLAPVARGVYRRTDTERTWHQSVWAACLRYAPAVADPLTTLALAGAVDRPRRIGVVVDHRRRVGGERLVRVTRMRDFELLAKLDRHPPQLELEPAAILAAAAQPDEQAIVTLLADVTHSRRTTPERLRAQLARQSRVAGRPLLEAVLVDLQDGACSNLERMYVHRVERAHGLPPARRQARVRLDGTVAFRDNEYLGGLLNVELDGRLGHDTSEDRWADADRDLATTLLGGRTLRLVWQQVLDSCRAARVVATLLQPCGWDGHAVPCGPTCSIEGRSDRGVFTAPTADNPPQ